jgi:lipoprotein-anchoring transpeptidase ErfK/SrfK
MSRSRVSRSLVAAVGFVIVLGAVFYLHNTTKSHAKDNSKETALAPPAVKAAPSAAVMPKPADTAAPAPVNHNGQIALPGNGRPMISQTPGAGETAKPATPNVHPPVDVKPPAETKNVAIPAKPIVENPSTPGSAKSGNVIADGKALLDRGDLFGARRLLNDALTSGQLSAADIQKAKDLIATANESLIFSPRRATNDPYVGSYTMQGGDRLMKVASSNSVTWDFLKRINNISDERRIRAGQTLKTVKGPFHAVVSKSKFVMDIYLGSPGEKGSMYVRSFGVGLGQHGSTPTGTWMVAPQGKLKNPKWWGTADEPAKEAGDPLNPLGKFWIGLNGTDGDAVGKEGFGIHGTIDPASIGKEMSHGCIRLVNENVEWVYQMLVDGKSTIIVKD